MTGEQVQPASASALHVSRDLVLDVIRASQGPFDLVDAFILNAVNQANVRALVDQFEVQARYSTVDAIPPDSERSPISISRVAQSLKLPFETVRRRVRALEAEGCCEVGRKGVVVPTAFFDTDQQRGTTVAVDSVVARKYRRLEAAGFFKTHPLPPSALPPGLAPVRTVARLSAGYVLRTLYVLQEVGGDYLNAVLLMQMTRINTAHLGDDRETSPAFRVDPIVPDDMKRPASALKISQELGLGFETALRRLIRMAEAGVCVHSRDGYYVQAEAFRQISPQLMATNDANLWRFYRSCAQFGAVEAWAARDGPEASNPAASAA